MAQRFFGWQVVGAAFVLALFAWGIGFYGPSVYVHALHARQGWSVSLISSAVTLHFLASALLVARLPALHRRFGLVAVTRAGLLASALGAVAWAWAGSPWHLLPAALLTALGWALCSGVAINAVVSPWFERGRPAALAMAFNGASAGGIVFVPLWAGLIGAFGFAGAGLVVAAATLLLCWPMAGRWFGPSPGSMGLHPDGASAPPTPRPSLAGAAPARPLWRQPRFRSLSLAFALGLTAQIGLLTQLVSMLAPTLGPQGAGWCLSLATACAVVGRTAVGTLLPAGTDRRRVGVANFLVQVAGSLALALADGAVPWLLLGSVLMGLGIGNLLSLPPLIAQAEWPAAEVGQVVALVTAVNQGFYAFGPGLFGLLLDQGGAWAPAAAAAALQMAAALVLWAGGDGGAQARPASGSSR
jgi:MFS family permease